MSAKKLIVIFHTQYGGWFDSTYTSLLSEFAQKDVVCKVATTPAQARRYFVSTNRPHAVILADDSVTKPACHELHARLAEYATAGGTVIFAGSISTSSLFPDPENMFSDVWGLPWRVIDRNNTSRETQTINPHLEDFNTAALVKQGSFPGRPINNVALRNAVYLPLRVANKFEKASPSPTDTCETLAAFATVGQGRLGYIGDHMNGVRERATTDLILAMCFRPGSCAPIAPGAVPWPTPTLPARLSGPRPRDAEVAIRAEARKKVREDKRMRADKVKNTGNDLFKREEWYEAAQLYREAAFLGGPQSMYLANLAACLLKLEQWELADSAASRALMYDPRHVKALYRRAVARRELGRRTAALADLEWLLTIDKNNTPALKEKEEVQRGMEVVGSLAWLEDQSVRSERGLDVALDVDDESDSEDFGHEGPSIACREYNTGEAGCRDGKACRFRHAPDSRSVRDELGRNVCVYWLLGDCRFAATNDCLYAHDAAYLPERGWWTDTARLERMHAEFDAAVKDEPLDLGEGPVEERILAEMFVPLPWWKDVWAVEGYEDDKEDESDYGVGSDSGDSEDDYVRQSGGEDSGDDNDDSYDYSLGRSEEDHEEDREEPRRELNKFGVTQADVEEMWEYGIKPWEDGAYAEMLRIRRILSRM